MSEQEPKHPAVEQADQVVWDYVLFMASQAMAIAEKERCGEGCGCPQCRKGAVNNLNSWVEWVSKGQNPKYEYRYNPKTRGVLRPDE